MNQVLNLQHWLKNHCMAQASVQALSLGNEKASSPHLKTWHTLYPCRLYFIRAL